MVACSKGPPPRPKGRAHQAMASTQSPPYRNSAPEASPAEYQALLTQILQEQRQTNQLLIMLIEALGEDGPDPDAEPQTYMDGSQV